MARTPQVVTKHLNELSKYMLTDRIGNMEAREDLQLLGTMGPAGVRLCGKREMSAEATLLGWEKGQRWGV